MTRNWLGRGMEQGIRRFMGQVNGKHRRTKLQLARPESMTFNQCARSVRVAAGEIERGRPREGERKWEKVRKRASVCVP